MSSILFKVIGKCVIFNENYFVYNFNGNCNNLKKFKHKLSSMGANKTKTETNTVDMVHLQMEKMKNSIREEYNSVTFEAQPTKSENDKKEYLVMRLGNGLKALLISDVKNLLDYSELEANTFNSEMLHLAGSIGSKLELRNKSIMSESAEKNISQIYKGHVSSNSGVNNIKSEGIEKMAACSLSVGVGSYSDPDKIPGLAHFLEHMLFMGSEKFPKENDFRSYITTRGGSSNAFTEDELTSFYFTCPDKYLSNVMERFANFFVSPLLNKDSIPREREAVDSEFQLNSSSDPVRVGQILFNTASLTNPAHKFKWGNLKTLKENVTDDELQNSLREFWKEQYSANLMTVAVQGRFPLDVLGKWVAKYFSDIPSKYKTLNVFPNIYPAFNMDLFNKIYTVLPVEDMNQLHLTWTFPSVKHLYRSKPLYSLSYLIDYKGEGSLFSYFHKKLWIIYLQAHPGSSENNSLFSTFSIDIMLTDEGLKHFEDIIEMIFSYIKLLKREGLPESVFRESQNIYDLAFRFQNESEPSDYVLELSHNMQMYPPTDYITGDRLLFEYKPNEVSQILELMRPDNVNIIILSKTASNQVTLDQTEQWFNTKFNSKDIPEQHSSKWENCQINSEFFLPKQNNYIPTNFEIIPSPEDKTKPEHPQKIISNDCMEVWFKQDTKFKLPYGYIALYLVSPNVSSFPQNSVMCDMFEWLFGYLIIKEAYPAGLAGLNVSVNRGVNGLKLVFDGFNHKIPLFLKTVLTEMISCARNKDIPEGLFEAIKEEMKKQYYNLVLDASALADQLYFSILCTNYWNSFNELEALHHITIEKCQEFNANLFDNLYIKCLIQGNISEEQAICMSQTIKEIIDYKPLLNGTYPKARVHELPLGENIIRVQSFNPEDTNCNVTNYYQFGQCSLQERCLIHILMLIMEEPLFYTLRTQEQLAYGTYCQFKNTRGILGFTMTVTSQAEKFDVQHVENRMTHFLKTFQKDLETMPLEDFDRSKESLKILLRIEDSNLREEVVRNFGEIVSDEYMFDRAEKQVECLEKINQSDLNNIYQKILNDEEDEKNNRLSMRKLSIQVDGEKNSHNKNEDKVTSDIQSKDDYRPSNSDHSLKIKIPDDKKFQHKFITNIEDFRSKMYIFPYGRRKNQ